jgi:hypothetical protein
MTDPSGWQPGPDAQPSYPPPPSYPTYPPPPYGYGYAAFAPPSNGIGTAGFVLGLLGLILCWFPFVGLALGVLGVILSGVGMSNGRRTGAPTGLAVAGLVLGLISLIPSGIILFTLATFSSS